MKKLTKLNQPGFTVLELMIATMVFSVVFLSATSALLQISHLYYKGVVGGRTQELTRGIIDQVSQQLQFTDATTINANPQAYIVTGGTDSGSTLKFQATCIGNTRYSYRINAKVDSNTPTAPPSYLPASHSLQHALWRDTITNAGSCIPADLALDNPSLTSLAPGTNGEELLDQNMRLSKFDVSCDNNSGDSTYNICHLAVGIIYGDDDLIADVNTANPTHCQSIVGSQWCTSTQFSTTVLKRLGN